jgi:hypothetical protein
MAIKTLSYITWQNADLAADDSTNWIEIPPDARLGCLHIGCTATDTPVGVLKIKVTGNSAQAVADADDYSDQPTTGPAAAAWQYNGDAIETAARYIALFYDRTSGGTGAVWTDNSAVAGTRPFINWRV